MTAQTAALRADRPIDLATIAVATATATQQEKAKPLWLKLVSWFGGVIVVLIVLAPFVPSLVAWVAASEVALTVPDWALLARMPVAVQLHLAAAMVSLPLGAFILWQTKGTATHKALGRVWVAAMLIACVSALFIKSFAPVLGPFGLIHLLVLWTLFSLGRGMHAILVRKDLVGHMRNMQGAYWGLVTAGLFSFVPGRVLWSMFTTM